MNQIRKYSERVNFLIELSNRTLDTTVHPKGIGFARLSGELFMELRTGSLSFIKNLYGEKHPYYIDFNVYLTHAEPHIVEKIRGNLKAIKSEIDNGWLTSMRSILSAEIFTDFLEMAEYLLIEKYEHPAAVLIGSVLEEHLRQLCGRNEIQTIESRGAKNIPKKADLLNAELTGKGVYNKLDQKNVTAWLDLRNKAAHGRYSEYNIQQVELMMHGVTEFISRTTS